MKQRPRQIDATKAVLTCSTLEAFRNAEGQEAETKNIEQIITPDQLLKEKGIDDCELQKNFHNIKSFSSLIPAIFIYYTHYYFRPKQFAEQTLKAQLPNKCREDYIIYKDPAYPDANQYELTDEDIHFLSTINEKLNTPVTIEDFELYLALLDAKSGKDVEIDFLEFQKLKLTLPKTINLQTQQVQEQLHAYFKKQRNHFSRPLTRYLMHPYYEDNNHHLAFRPRIQPMEKTMKLRRGNAQNPRGVSEMENLGQKIVLLKKDLLMVSNLIDQSIQREKAMEIERRFGFCKFIKEFFDQSKKDSASNSEIKLWPKDCFVRESAEKCSINIVERADEMFDNISKEIIHWRELNEQQRRDKQKKEDQINRYEKSIEDLIAEKLKFEEKPPERIPIIPPTSPPKKIVEPVPPPAQIDEKMESVAKFLSTLYLEARKYQLTFDAVMSDTFPIYKIQNQQQPVHAKNVFPYSLMQIEGNDLVYKVRKDSLNQLERKDKAYWESYQDSSITNTLYSQHDYFKEKINDIMEMADMDQMVYVCQEDDNDEEKNWKRKIPKQPNTVRSSANGGQLK